MTTIDTAALAKLAAERFEQSADASFIDDSLTVVLFTPTEWRALAALLRGVVDGPKVKPLEWHKSKIAGWNDDWH
ncbi:hypothetical protein, partial [Xanthobacter versatilis]|uniref:hypothetical protein n=1 Tax=Xanthobacter autotrophicus (strain ATCC BAA-1158 / Py2) TaxID=78245 RepID=UPI0037267237